MKNKLLFLSFVTFPIFLFSQENEAPKVKIIYPSEDAKLEGGSILPYSIVVSDKEDGQSEYDEINKAEVILTSTYLTDPLKVKKYAKEEVSHRSEVLSMMSISNCLTCHKAKDKLIGPSFEEIAKRYSPTLGNKEYLTKQIIKGSKDVWSDVIMPAQPELAEEEISQILDWIFDNAQDPNYTFYVGTEGALKTQEKLDDGVYILHALYTDHGLSEPSGNSKKGEHTIILKVKDQY